MANTPMKRSNWMNGELVSLPLLFLAGGTEVSTGFVLPTNSIIYPHEMWMIVDTLDSGVTVDVGILSTETGGDADGFLDGVSAATATLVKPTVTITQGTNAHYISATTFGILFLAAACKGANVSGQSAVPVFTPYISDGVAKTISYTPSASDTFVGRLVFRLRQLPV
jgi:hypothetical protein